MKGGKTIEQCNSNTIDFVSQPQIQHARAPGLSWPFPSWRDMPPWPLPDRGLTRASTNPLMAVSNLFGVRFPIPPVYLLSHHVGSTFGVS